MPGKPKHISPKLLTADEKVLIETRTSKVKHMTGGAFSLILMLGSLLLAYWDRIFPSTTVPVLSELLTGTYGWLFSIAFLVLAALFLLNFIVRYLKWISTLYAMTNARVITKKGILGRSFEDMPLDMITNIDVSQSAVQRLLGYGTVVFSSQSGARDDVVWKWVPDPIKTRRKVQEAMDKRQ